MGILRYIWIKIFGKSKKQEGFGVGGSAEMPTLRVVHRNKNISERTNLLDAEYVGHIESETSTVTFVKSKSKVLPPKTKSKYKGVVKSGVIIKEQEVIQYLLKYGSIDKRTCVEKFGLKRLDNLICELRKDGMNIKNETVELHNELGEKTKVNNYRLVTSDATN